MCFLHKRDMKTVTCSQYVRNDMKQQFGQLGFWALDVLQHHGMQNNVDNNEGKGKCQLMLANDIGRLVEDSMYFLACENSPDVWHATQGWSVQFCTSYHFCYTSIVSRCLVCLALNIFLSHCCPHYLARFDALYHFYRQAYSFLS